CAKKGITTRWQYIIFKYNENHIEQARQMAKDNGIIFEISTSARFEGPDDPYRPTNPYHYIDPTQFALVRKLNV